MKEQIKVGVPLHMRVDGYLYDADSGILMGVASDQQKALHKWFGSKVPVYFKDTRSGCPHNLVIHRGSQE